MPVYYQVLSKANVLRYTLGPLLTMECPFKSYSVWNLLHPLRLWKTSWFYVRQSEKWVPTLYAGHNHSHLLFLENTEIYRALKYIEHRCLTTFLDVNCKRASHEHKISAVVEVMDWHKIFLSTCYDHLLSSEDMRVCACRYRVNLFLLPQRLYPTEHLLLQKL